jgi:hypothetical protein
VEVFKKGDKLANCGLAQSSFPPNKHPPQLGANRRQFVNLPIQINEFLPEEILDCATRGISRAVPPKDFGQLMKREPRALCWGHPLEVLDFSRGPEAVSRGRALGLRYNSDSLVVADTIWSHADDPGKLADR